MRASVLWGCALAACLVSAALSGCAAPTAQLSPDALDRMQRESRLEIYDRENDVVIAENRRDEVRLREETQKRDLEALEARDQKQKARAAKADPARAAGLQKTLAARRAYLELEQRVETVSLAVADESVAAASARLEQTRQRQLVRTGRALTGSMAPFDARLDALEKRVRQLERRVQDIRADSEKAFESWQAAEDEYTKLTGDYDTGIWLD